MTTLTNNKTENTMNWTVKNVKSWNGQEGRGTTCILYRDSKKVASCRDDAMGGPWSFDWFDYKAPRVSIDLIVFDYDAEKDEKGNRPEKAHSYNGSPEEKLLVEYANKQIVTAHNFTYRKDCDSIVSDLCDEADRLKAEKSRLRKLKTKTLFVLKEKGKETEYAINTPFTPEFKAELEAKYGDSLVRFVNTEFVDDSVALKAKIATIRRLCKKKTAVRFEGESLYTVSTFKVAFTKLVAIRLRMKFPKIVEIYNENPMF